MTWPPQLQALSLGWIIALIVLILAILMFFGIVPATVQVVAALIGALALARLI